MRSSRQGDQPRFPALFDHLNNVVLWTASENGFEYISAGFEDIFGIPAEKARNDITALLDHIHHDDRDFVRALIDQPPEEIDPLSYQCRVIRQVGSDRWVSVRQMPVRDEAGNFEYVVGSSTDITEQKRREKELERQKERLDEFASIVSHDLRNPLNVASGRLELAKMECDSDHLDDVANAHERMEMMIEDLLTLAREGEPSRDTSSVQLESLVAQAWANVDTAEGKLVSDIDTTATADRNRLLQLFENLFRNAVEHGGDHVTVTVGELPTGFYVEDDGPGIPTTNHDEVLESGFSTTEAGTGLGLSIVEQIATAHGWTISISQSEAGGARFEITGINQSNEA